MFIRVVFTWKQWDSRISRVGSGSISPTRGICTHLFQRLNTKAKQSTEELLEDKLFETLAFGEVQTYQVCGECGPSGNEDWGYPRMNFIIENKQARLSQRASLGRSSVRNGKHSMLADASTWTSSFTSDWPFWLVGDWELPGTWELCY